MVKRVLETASVRQLAGELNVTPRTVYNWRAKRTVPHPDNYRKLAAMVDYSFAISNTQPFWRLHAPAMVLVTLLSILFIISVLTFLPV